MNPLVSAFNPVRRLALNLWVGFAVAMVLFLSVIGLGVHQMQLLNTKLERIVDVYNVKSRLASHMRDTLRDRAIVMHDIVVSIDPWEKEDLFEKFLSYGEQYQKDRTRLGELLDTQEEKALMERLDQITNANQPIMYDVVESARDQNNYGALTLLQEKAIPLQAKLVAALDDMSKLQREATDNAARKAVTDYKNARTLMLAMGTLATFLAMLAAWLVGRRVSRQTRLLDNEKLKFQTLFESNSDAVVILDDKGFTDCNTATLQMFGMSSVDEFLSTPIPALGAPRQGPQGEDAAAYAMRMIGQARSQGHAFMEWQGRRSNGSLFPAEIALHAMELEGKPVIQAIMRDISDRKQVEQAMAGARDAALSAARTKSEFVANVSHEIRTPLHGILGMTDLLLKTHLHSADQREYALALKQSAASLLTVINDLLDFSKIEAGKLKLEQVPFDLRALLDEINNLYRPLALEKGLKLRLEGLESLQCCVLGDPHRLRQILLNLVDNAFKFTLEGGVRVRVDRLADDRYRISVTDTGIGIAPENMAHLFEAFAQADSSTTRRFGGTGLGLTISRQLMEMMGGTIDVESPPSGVSLGTCFTLTLPLKSVSAKLQTPRKEMPPRFHGRALIVEDNPVNQKVLYYQLRGLGMDVEVAESGDGALRHLKQDSDWDIIFMDWQMPGMDGFATTEAIRATPGQAKLIPIVALTANVAPGFRATCLQAGMDDYLSKPYTESDLNTILNRWLGKEKGVVDVQTAQSSATLEPQVPAIQEQPLSVDKLRERMGSNAAILGDMLRVFVDTTEGLLLDLSGALENQDFSLAGKKCHSLRGAAAAVLAGPLLAQAKDLENALKLNDMETSQARLDDVEAEFIRIRHYLESGR
ncbi:MAG: ATP-binding protein [Thiobacillaceae bacterium]